MVAAEAGLAKVVAGQWAIIGRGRLGFEEDGRHDKAPIRRRQKLNAGQDRPRSDLEPDVSPFSGMPRRIELCFKATLRGAAKVPREGNFWGGRSGSARTGGQEPWG